MPKTLFIALGPTAAVLAGLLMSQAGWDNAACWTAAVTVCCAVWWVSEAIPIPATAMLPLALFPLVGVLKPGDIGQSIGSPLVLLMLGGFMLSSAMEKSGAHRRLALNMVTLFGQKSNRNLVFGFMAASALLSMWISNTATALMLLPIAIAVLQNTENKKLSTALLLGIAYAASVGGIGTPIGTPTNLVFMKVYQDTTGTEFSFLDWMQLGLPVVIIFLPVIAIWLTHSLKTDTPIALPRAGAWRSEEIRMLLVFALTALAWITRKEPYGGWSALLGLPQANDASVALLAVLLMFLIADGKGGRLLDWKSAERIPWGILILFGAGIAIAKAFTVSGLSEAIGMHLSALTHIPLWLLIGLICLAVTFLTEITSNIATTALLLPILAAASYAIGVDAAVLMVPATVSASCAFMLPVATPPNAVIFGSGRLTIATMASRGLILNLLGVGLITTIYMLSMA